MILGVPTENIGIGSGWLLVVVFVVLLMSGRIIPRRTYDDVVRDRDEWRAAHQISESARAEGVRQTQELLEHARTTDAFIRSLPRVGGGS